MSDVLQLTISGLSLGAAYALVALGFVVIYKSSQVFNFAHGELLGVGAFLMTSFAGLLPWPIALAATLLATGVLAALIERAVIRPMIGAPVFVTIILTLFVANLLRAVIVIGWGVDPRGMPTWWDREGTTEILGTPVFYNSLASMGAGALALVAFFLLLKYTRLGIGMRATQSDQEVALALGVPVGRIFAASWFIAGVLAALAGVFMSMHPQQLDSNVGFVALRAFPAVIVGGLTSPVGTVIAGLLLGLLEVYSGSYVGPHLGAFGNNLHEVFPYLVMILVLMVRPYGLLGEREVRRV